MVNFLAFGLLILLTPIVTPLFGPPSERQREQTWSSPGSKCHPPSYGNNILESNSLFLFA